MFARSALPNIECTDINLFPDESGIEIGLYQRMLNCCRTGAADPRSQIVSVVRFAKCPDFSPLKGSFPIKPVDLLNNYPKADKHLFCCYS